MYRCTYVMRVYARYLWLLMSGGVSGGVSVLGYNGCECIYYLFKTDGRVRC